MRSLEIATTISRTPTHILSRYPSQLILRVNPHPLRGVETPSMIHQTCLMYSNAMLCLFCAQPMDSFAIYTFSCVPITTTLLEIRLRLVDTPLV
jgi:hypothetical protein